MKLFRALVLGYMRANRLRAGISVFAVALGVAIALAIELANATAVASFATNVNLISSDVNVQVLGIGQGFADRALLRVRAVPGVRVARPAIEDEIVVGARRGDPLSGEIVRVLGVDMLGADILSNRADAVDPNLLVNENGAIVSERLGKRHGWRRGSIVAALAGDRAIRLRIAGFIPAGTVGVDSSVVFVDIASAQEIFGKIGHLDRIDVAADPARRDAVVTAIARVIPPGTRVVTPTVRTDEIHRMLQSFQLNLAVLSYVALLVGIFLIYNAVAISVVQRRAEIGTLRALGARRSEIFRTFLAEGALLGTIGAALGVLGGWLLARFAVSVVANTVDTLYVGAHADGVILDPLLLLRAFGIGVVVTIVAAIVPSLDAAATPPATAMRAAGYERRLPHFASRAAFAAAGALLVAWLLTLAPPIDGVPYFAYAAGLAIVVAGSLVAPLAVELLARFSAALFRRSLPAEWLGAVQLGAAPLRHSVAVAALAVAIGLTVAIAILVGSFRATVVAWANDTLRADLFVQPIGLQDASSDGRFAPDVVASLAKVPGVAAVATYRGITVPFRGRLVTLAAGDFRAKGARSDLRFMGGVDPLAVTRALPESMNVVVSEPFARRFGIARGERFPITTASGEVVVRVLAVYTDYSSDAGAVMMDRTTFVHLMHDDTVNAIGVAARSGVDLATLRTALIRAARPHRIDVQTNRELRALILAIFNRTFAITYALYVIAIAIAVLGIVSTLFSLVLERRREIGMLRELGLRMRDVRRMVYTEAACIGVLGGVLGVTIGVLTALLLIFVINVQAFGWLVELHLPYDFLLEAIVLVVLAAVLAGRYPANVAARIRTADAVRSE